MDAGEIFLTFLGVATIATLLAIVISLPGKKVIRFLIGKKSHKDWGDGWGDGTTLP